MRQVEGNVAPELRLPAWDGGQFSTAELEGRRYLLSFFRFASCPLCNMRMHLLVRRFSAGESV
jgi:peroxiredoxin